MSAPLFDIEPFIDVTYLAESTLQDRFEAFHRANPWVYKALVALARDLSQRGHRKIGMKMLFEVLRWQHALQTTGDEWKLNNNWTSRYARLIAQQEADLAQAFDMRELKAA